MIVTASARRMSKPVVTTPDPVVLIRSSAYASLPAPGNRVGTGDIADMPTIRSSSATGTPAILTADGAHHYRLVGLNIEAHASGGNGAIVQIGGGETTLAEFPTDITIDRCVIRGDDASATRRGVQLDCIRGAVIDSHIDRCLDTSDSQAVWAYNTPGPLKVVNNYLEATGENLMMGGNDPSYANSVPSDIEIRRNYFKKQSAASWATTWTVKNLLEFKNAQRVLVEGNYFDTTYADNQEGYVFLITPRNQNGTAPWSVTQDITVRLNKALNAPSGFNILGRDSDYTSQETTRITVQDNCFDLKQIFGETTMRGHLITGGPSDVQIINNTVVMRDGGPSGYFENVNFFLVGTKAVDTVWRNNIFYQGLAGSDSGPGTDTFDRHFTDYTFSYNLVIGETLGNYPTANNQAPAARTDVFVDYAAADFTVKSPYLNDGSDGTDPGCDITALNAAILHSVDGQWGAEPATYTDQTYTNAELPRSYIDTTYANQTGTTHVCTTAAEFTTALANCAIGDIIELQAGTTFTGSFTLRDI